MGSCRREVQTCTTLPTMWISRSKPMSAPKTNGSEEMVSRMLSHICYIFSAPSSCNRHRQLDEQLVQQDRHNVSEMLLRSFHQLMQVILTVSTTFASNYFS